ncbi:MAG TPA: hypothetical protein VJB66_03070 [Candidatus Nanoarchaeia archaeon]|nr:hypothetical protein [Candidatus Nanoarchaeia archaeon]
MHKKGALDLSISTIVIVIICSVCLVASVVFLTQLVDTSDDTTSQVSVKLVKEENNVYVAPQSAQSTPSQSSEPRSPSDEPIVMFKQTPEIKLDCLKDLNCDFYFTFVPLGEWDSQLAFDKKADARAQFFIDISKFKYTKVGIITVPLDFAAQCGFPNKIDQKSAAHHQKVKGCADKYADKVGIDYERAVGLLSDYSGGRAFFGEKAMISALGFKSGSNEFERPGIVAHELGHTYDLCDEYALTFHKQQKSFTTKKKCENSFPQQCDASMQDCEGNTPTFRDYEGQPILNVCGGSVHYSIMGFSRGSECGLDRTGGYEAYGDIDE